MTNPSEDEKDMKFPRRGTDFPQERKMMDAVGSILGKKISKTQAKLLLEELKGEREGHSSDLHSRAHPVDDESEPLPTEDEGEDIFEVPHQGNRCSSAKEHDEDYQPIGRTQKESTVDRIRQDLQSIEHSIPKLRQQRVDEVNPKGSLISTEGGNDSIPTRIQNAPIIHKSNMEQLEEDFQQTELPMGNPTTMPSRQEKEKVIRLLEKIDEKVKFLLGKKADLMEIYRIHELPDGMNTGMKASRDAFLPKRPPKPRRIPGASILNRVRRDKEDEGF